MFLAALLLAAPASAQVDRPEYVRALAAGYKASFLCSDIFNAGQVGSSRVDLQACKLEYSIVSPK